jgi:hypothetical protein
MTAVSLDSYLLLIALIISFVILFLCLYTALLLSDVAKRIATLISSNDISEMEGQPGNAGRQQRPHGAMSREEMTLRDSLQEPEDILPGIGRIAGKYHIDSLVVALPDGLVVASSGSSDPEYDAAYYSNLFAGDYSLPDKGVSLFPIDLRGIPLIGIARSRKAIKKDLCIRMAEEIELLFKRKF